MTPRTISITGDNPARLVVDGVTVADATEVTIGAGALASVLAEYRRPGTTAANNAKAKAVFELYALAIARR